MNIQEIKRNQKQEDTIKISLYYFILFATFARNLKKYINHKEHQDSTRNTMNIQKIQRNLIEEQTTKISLYSFILFATFA